MWHRRSELVLALTVICLGWSAAAAAAALPPTATVSNAVVTDAGGVLLATMTFTTRFTETGATGEARATALRLAGGKLYRLRTCVSAKAAQRAPQATCATAQAAPALLGSLIAPTPAPAALLNVERPAAGEAAATIAAVLVVDEQRDGRWVAYASSWPAAGLPAAGVAVPAVDQTQGSVLAPQGLVRPGTRQGGVDSGAQDSVCLGTETAATAPAQGSSTALGELAAPYEVQQQTTATLRGTMILLHGGTWQAHGAGALEWMRGDAARWRARGWRTVNGDYRPCARSVEDALALLDRVRATYGDARPICIVGQSAGGHLALVVASQRRQVSCVVSLAGIADTEALAHESAYRDSAGGSTALPISLVNVLVSAFGADRIALYSPTLTGVAARVLYGVSRTDSFIPWTQATDFAAAQAARDPDGYVDVQHLDGDDLDWVHGRASGAAAAEFRAREDLLIAPLIRGAVSAPAGVGVQRLRSRGVRLVVSCPSSCRLALKLTLDRRTARRLNLPTTVATATARRAKHGSAPVVVRLSARGRAGITKRTRLHVSVAMTANGKTKRFTARVAVR
jgi:acetyl esterase/lipase